PPNSLVSHPLSSDSLLMAAFDHGKPERIQRWRGGLSTSPLLDGAGGPLVSVGGEHGVEFVGAEKITRSAGNLRHAPLPTADAAPRRRRIAFLRHLVHWSALCLRARRGARLPAEQDGF